MLLYISFSMYSFSAAYFYIFISSTCYANTMASWGCYITSSWKAIFHSGTSQPFLLRPPGAQRGMVPEQLKWHKKSKNRQRKKQWDRTFIMGFSRKQSCRGGGGPIFPKIHADPLWHINFLPLWQKILVPNPCDNANLPLWHTKKSAFYPCDRAKYYIYPCDKI